MNILHLTLKKQWFNLISTGENTQLYADGRQLSKEALFVAVKEKVPNINPIFIEQLNKEVFDNYTEYYKVKQTSIETLMEY